MKYLVLYERSETGWGAYAPDLPVSVSAAKTQDEANESIREAVEFHRKVCASTVTRFQRRVPPLSTSRFEAVRLRHPSRQSPMGWPVHQQRRNH
jgi:predicted RNase H-like HicB family nuclease